MTFERFDTVVVPFPFTDHSVRLRRPAIVLSDAEFGQATGQSLLAMITRAERSNWLGDCLVSEPEAAGLTGPSVVRMKLFTLVNSLIDRKLGCLGVADAAKVRQALAQHLGLGVD